MSQDPVERKTFEVKMRIHPNGSIEKRIFIGGEMLDWSVDSSSYLEAKKMGPMYERAVQADIAKHFTESVSEVLGRRVTMDEIKEAIKNGWI